MTTQNIDSPVLDDGVDHEVFALGASEPDADASYAGTYEITHGMVRVGGKAYAAGIALKLCANDGRAVLRADVAKRIDGKLPERVGSVIELESGSPASLLRDAIEKYQEFDRASARAGRNLDRLRSSAPRLARDLEMKLVNVWSGDPAARAKDIGLQHLRELRGVVRGLQGRR